MAYDHLILGGTTLQPGKSPAQPREECHEPKQWSLWSLSRWSSWTHWAPPKKNGRVRWHFMALNHGLFGRDKIYKNLVFTLGHWSFIIGGFTTLLSTFKQELLIAGFADEKTPSPSCFHPLSAESSKVDH